VHRTVSGAQAGAPTNSPPSGIVGDAAAKIHRTFRCAPNCPVSQRRPRQRSRAINGRHVASANGHQAAPNCPVCYRTVRCAKGNLAATVGFAKQGRRSHTVHVRWWTGLSGAPTDRRQLLPTKWSSNGS
jgi:hypothetical protein